MRLLNAPLSFTTETTASFGRSDRMKVTVLLSFLFSSSKAVVLQSLQQHINLTEIFLLELEVRVEGGY